jgi:hypothetical protein
MSMNAETPQITSRRQAGRGQVHPPAAIVARSEGELLPPGVSWIEAEQVMINPYNEPLEFEIQESPASGWRRAIDTGLASPLDIAEPGAEPPVVSLRYRVVPRSVVVLLGGGGQS